MDEKGFRKFLERNKLSVKTIRNYVTSVKEFESWLAEDQGVKRIEDANKGDFNRWASYLYDKGKANSTVLTYFQGIKQYYRSKRKDKMVKTIDEIKSKLRRPQPALHLLGWNDFKDVLEKAEEKGVSKEKLALLNLLWSEMPSEDILDLYISDIDFEKSLISPIGVRGKRKVYRVTWKAWGALQKYVPIEDRGKKEKLFTINIRSVQKLTEELVRQTPKGLKKSCERDFVDAGKKVRFDYGEDKKPSLKEEKEPEEKLPIEENLFDRLDQEIRKFGGLKWIRYQIPKIKDHKELQRLLEGYLLATFPDEVITHEFHFKGYEKKNSIIDITIGDPMIPIEVKLAKKKMRDYIGKGSEQVKEFLKSSGSKRGILVIGDKKREPKRLRLSEIRNGVCIIVI